MYLNEIIFSCNKSQGCFQGQLSQNMYSANKKKRNLLCSLYTEDKIFISTIA